MSETTLVSELDLAYQGTMEKARETNHPGNPEDDFEDAMLLKRARDRLAQYESQCIPRTADIPEWAVIWEKTRGGVCYWHSPMGHRTDASAPDLLPDEPGPVYRHIVDVGLVI